VKTEAQTEVCTAVGIIVRRERLGSAALAGVVELSWRVRDVDAAMSVGAS
jgi:hypothetical protein